MTTHPTHHAGLRGEPETAPHERAFCEPVPSDWLYTHNRICACGEIVSESWWERHQASHGRKEKTT